MDPRDRKLAELLVDYSMGVKPGDNLLVETIGVDPLPLTRDVVEIALRRGALVHITIRDDALLRRMLLHGSEEQIAALARFALPRMQEMQCYTGIRGTSNTREWADVPPEKLTLFNRHVQEAVHLKVRVPNTRWVVLRYPNAAMAQQAGIPQEAFADFYYDVCTLDYAKMSAAMDPLRDLMLRTNRVRIVGPDTELEFSIEGLPVIKCDGHVNIPDGELYTAPVKGSINGRILFNTPMLYEGTVFPSVRIRFVDGKAVGAATDGDNTKLNAILDRDEGARYVGEFSFGFNPYITGPILDTLFDEKIVGSIHMAMGNSYDDCDNTNKSGIHWDMVHRQTPACGGGEIWFDGVLIRKDGLFVPDELQSLNPENLM